MLLKENAYFLIKKLLSYRIPQGVGEIFYLKQDLETPTSYLYTWEHSVTYFFL